RSPKFSVMMCLQRGKEPGISYRRRHCEIVVCLGLRRFLRCFKLRQVRVDVGSERRVLAQSREMAHGPRKFGVDLRMQNRIEALLFECPDSRPLVEEETHFGDEADVREGDLASHQERV